MAKVDALMNELRDLFPSMPPAHARPFGKLLADLRAEGKAVTPSRLRAQLAELVASGKWAKGRVGNSTHYWPKP